MSCLKIYFQFAFGFGRQLEDFKMKCSYSEYDIICITCSLTNESISDEQLVNKEMFDIFRLDAQYNVEKNISTHGTFIAARKHLSAYIRREWMVAGVECVWITVPSRGCRSRLHIACVDFFQATNIDPFTETLLSLSKNHRSDKFLVLGRFPPLRFEDWTSKKHRQTSKLQSSTTGKPENEVIQKIHSIASLAGLGQFNNMKIKKISHLVFSSVPVAVTHSNPLAPWLASHPLFMDYNDWFKMTLKFDLNIGPPECCKTPNDATGTNCRNALSGQCEADRKDVVASGDVSNITDELVETTRDKVIKLRIERLEDHSRKISIVEERFKIFEDSSKKFANVFEYLKLFEDNSKAIANIENRLKIFEDDSKKFTNVEERLQTFEDNSKTLANIEERFKTFDNNSKKITTIDKRLQKFEDNLKAIANIEEHLRLFEDDSKKITDIDKRLKIFEDDSKIFTKIDQRLQTFDDYLKKYAIIEERLKTLDETHRETSRFEPLGPMSASLFTRTISERDGGRASGAASAFGSTAPGLFGDTSVPGKGLFETSSVSGPAFEGSWGQQSLSFNQSNLGLFFGHGPHTGFFSQPSTSVLNAFGGKSEGFRNQQTTGTAVKYTPLRDTDLIVKDDQSQLINIHYTCITFMKEYEHKSLEELRMEDYTANRMAPGQLQHLT